MVMSRTHSASTYWSLDGVPFRLNERFLPPKKVTLPLDFEDGNRSDVVFVEYDFTTEEQVVRDFEVEMRRQKEEQRRKEEAAAAAAEVAQITSCSVEDVEEEVRVTQTQEIVTPAEQTDETVVQPPRDIVQPISSTLTTKPVYHMVDESGILLPMPASNALTATNSPAKLHRNFDLRDFENEQDPFENLSLQVINDKEELDKVFLATSNPVHAQSRVNTHPSNVSVPGIVNTGPHGVHQASAFVGYNYSASSGNLELTQCNGSTFANFRPSTNDAHFKPAPNLNSLANDTSCKNGVTAAYYHPNSSSCYNNFSSQTARVNTTCVNSLPRAVSNASPNSSSITSGESVRFSTLLNSGLSQLDRSPCQNSDASSKSSNQWLLRNEKLFNEVAPLRSTKSVPDIAACERAYTDPANSRRTPPPYMANTSRHDTDTRQNIPYSAVSYLSSESRVSKGLSPKGAATCPSSVQPQTIYSKLTDEERRFSDAIVGMGFKRDHVLAIVKRIGMDEKVVLDHLFLLSSLSEEGYSITDIQDALFCFNNDSDKVRCYLQLLQKLCELGFHRDRVKDALVKNNLDQEKSLDALIGF